MVEQKNKNIYIQYSMAFLLSGILVFLAILIRHSGFVAVGDCFNSYYPVLVFLSKYYKNLISSVCNHTTMLYSTSLGFGDNIIGVLNWAGLGDVFTLISSLFPERYMSYGYTIITVLRLYLAGITFVYYGRYKKICSKSLIIGALLYVFSFYSLSMGLNTFTFITAIVYFPLMIFGIDWLMEKQMLKTKAFCWILVVVVFLQSMCGFYFLYMDILACLFYFLVRGVDFVVQKKYSVTELFKAVFSIAIHFTIGIGMSCFILFPVIAEYMQCTRRGDTSISLLKVFALPEKDFLLNSLRNVITPAHSLYVNGLCMPIIIVPLIVFFISMMKKHDYKKQVLFIAISIWGCIFPAVGIISNGFAYNAVRWTYILFFFMSYLVAVYFETLVTEFSIKEFRICIILFAVWLFTQVILNSSMKQICVYSVLWIALLYLLYKLILSSREENDKKRLLYFAVFSIIFSGFMFFAPVKIGGSGAGASFKWIKSTDKEIQNSKLACIGNQNVEEQQFFRYDFNDTSLDAPLMIGVNSTYSYYSMYNGNVYNIFNQLRISPAIMHNFIIQGLDGRQALETLMSVKTYATDTDKWDLETNKYFLPLGFTYKQAVSEESLKSLSQLQKMNVMMSYLIIDDKTNGTLHEKSARAISDNSIKQIPTNISYGNDIIRKGNTIYVNKGSKIRVKFAPQYNKQPGDELYIILRNLTSNPSFKADINLSGKTIRCRAKKDEWYYDNNFDYLVQVQNSASKGAIDIVFQNAGEYTLDGIELVENSIGNFEDKYNELRENTLDHVSIDGNSINGTINLNEGKWVFISLPYDKGWSCEVDNSKTEIVRANYSFMAIYVKPGTHTVHFEYMTPGLKAGIIVSVLSVIAFCSLFIIQKLNSKK